MKTLLQDWQRPLELSLRFRAASMAALVLISGCALTHKRSPYHDPDRLVRVVKVASAGEEPILDRDFLAWRDQSQTLGQIATYVFRGFSLTDGPAPERIHSALVSADFFHTLGVQPALGRAFLPEECKLGRNHVVVVSHNLWQRRFSGDPSLIGRAITLDQEKYTVIGVMPPDFQFPKECEVWAPLVLDDESPRLKDKSLRLEALARLKPGITLQQAQAEMSVIAHKLEGEYPETNASRGVKLTSLGEGGNQKSQKVITLELRPPATRSKTERPARLIETGKEK